TGARSGTCRRSKSARVVRIRFFRFFSVLPLNDELSICLCFFCNDHE
ncbi:hypothetical protein LINPERHAP1_LOCUS22424, partial [Linum perenne]